MQLFKFCISQFGSGQDFAVKSYPSKSTNVLALNYTWSTKTKTTSTATMQTGQVQSNIH